MRFWRKQSSKGNVPIVFFFRCLRLVNPGPALIDAMNCVELTMEA